MRFELHCHSTCSDGTEGPDKVAARALSRKVEIFALTDHDTCAGSAVTIDHVALAAPGTRVLRGVELSCDDPETGRTIHVLAYDRGHPGWSELEARLVSLGEARRNRLRVMAARLAQRGIRIDIEPLLAATGRSVGRPDLARAMVKHGAVTSMKEAFSRHLYDGGPVDVPHHALSLPDALALGGAAGAALGLAHPHLYDDHGVRLLKQYAPQGLSGVEAYYGSYDPRERSRWLAVADELGLVCTGGSDWHGPDDSTVQPGVDFPPARAERLIEWLTAA